MVCDFCNTKLGSPIYKVPTSLIGAEVYKCSSCGLVQSKYKDKTKKHKNKSISSGADWGNVRHGKKIRLQQSLDVIKMFGLNFNSVVDIGSNRGHFVNWVSDNYPECEITAIEPDNRIIDNYVDNPNLLLVNDRIENIEFEDKVDFVYCCHTLEHVDSASSTLQQIKSILHNKGYLYLDVPSLSVLKNKDGVEEFFIDKHTFHFSNDVLINYLKLLGFKIKYNLDDGYNIVILAVKDDNEDNLIENYIDNLSINYAKLKVVGKKINKMSSNSKVAVIGASKIYDALVRHGDLNVEDIDYVIDDYLYGYIDDVHGKKLNKISILDNNNVDNIILLTRSATSKLISKLKNNNIITFTNLINKI